MNQHQEILQVNREIVEAITLLTVGFIDSFASVRNNLFNGYFLYF